jgi:hypothetical protein
MQFEFHIYKGDDHGAVSDKAEIKLVNLKGDSSAKAKAGGFAKQANGPVDLCYAGDQAFNERYITTASPSKYHASGYRFERLT